MLHDVKISCIGQETVENVNQSIETHTAETIDLIKKEFLMMQTAAGLRISKSSVHCALP